MDIVEFLTARLDEDEKVALLAGQRPWDVEPKSSALFVLDDDFGTLVVRRHRALADIAAKRAIIHRLHHSAYSGIRGGDAERFVECACGWERILSDRERYDDLDFYRQHLESLGVTEIVSTGILRHLAQPYADHPDFDPAWRVEPATA